MLVNFVAQMCLRKLNLRRLRNSTLVWVKLTGILVKTVYYVFFKEIPKLPEQLQRRLLLLRFKPPYPLHHF